MAHIAQHHVVKKYHFNVMLREIQYKNGGERVEQWRKNMQSFKLIIILLNFTFYHLIFAIVAMSTCPFIQSPPPSPSLFNSFPVLEWVCVCVCSIYMRAVSHFQSLSLGVLHNGLKQLCLLTAHLSVLSFIPVAVFARTAPSLLCVKCN